VPVYDHECECGKITEAIMPVDCDCIECECGKTAKRIISCGGQYCSNEDATWLKSVLEVVDKESTKPETREFIANPTRTNYNRWMKSEGLRPVDHGEKINRYNPDKDFKAIHNEVWRRHRERKRIEI
jgi:hypothetical protein